MPMRKSLRIIFVPCAFLLVMVSFPGKTAYASTLSTLFIPFLDSNIGRGYVLRRIIRRALRSAQQLGINGKYLNDMLDSLLG